MVKFDECSDNALCSLDVEMIGTARKLVCKILEIFQNITENISRDLGVYVIYRLSRLCIPELSVSASALTGL